MVEVSNDMLDEILKEAGSQYFFHKEDTGEVTLTFESGILKVEPGEEDAVGRIWNPPTTDKQGNPILDFQGNVKEPWVKFEAKVLIKGIPHVYSFSGIKSSILKNFIMAMKKAGIENNKLPGTTWSIDRVGKWDWSIKYLGREGDNKSPSKPSTLDPKIVEALKAKKDQSANGLPKNDLIAFLALVMGKKTTDIEKIWPSIVEDKLVKIIDNKVFIL